MTVRFSDPCQQAVVDEERALEEKIGAIREIIHSEQFSTRTQYERDLMIAQCDAMVEYHYALGTRIAYYNYVNKHGCPP